ncbi:cystathionine beta-lyase [Kaistia algarum]|uniref:cystathionine beta-lyase n=1 Tax=Kaistia algarum TaxID=2083279 RepID=UPI000CE8DA92|nr:cystathionine beta-lyase [Kaistia algarum]MCX5514922.1 cystathionine beta-lyase [Kaistia algarum]PPE79670.1 cystathionine beta-lyase [Kaistia algarum]
MSRNDNDPSSLHPATRLIRSGRDGDLTGPFVNPPVVHASTVLFDTVANMRPGGQRYGYGRQGTPTIEALEQAVSELEGAAGAVLCPSGLNAVSTALLSVLASGDHLLMADNVYGPSRDLAKSVLARLGIETTFFDPRDIDALPSHFRHNTRAVYVESPGSLTFEMTDIPKVAAIAHQRGARVIADNTWATPLLFRPLQAGADLAVVAGTKYLSGHSDVMIGTVAAAPDSWSQLKATHQALGLCVGPDDIYLTLRGLRTMAVRLERHQKTALALAQFLKGRPEVERVLYPALSDDSGHAIWQRDMSGASGLFGVVFAGWSGEKTAVFLEALRLFGLGYSWGGFESLAIPAHLHRSAMAMPPQAALIRLHAGLEDADDLIADLTQAFTVVAEL